MTTYQTGRTSAKMMCDCGRYLGMYEGYYNECEDCRITPLIQRIRTNLTSDLLKPKFRGSKWPTGHCYVASECFYHIHGQYNNWTPYCARLDDGGTHWWLQRHEEVVDITYDQFVRFDYNKGHKQFFVNYPSKRCLTLAKRIKDVSISDS